MPKLSKLKIAFVHPWGEAKRYDPLIWDGLHAALNVVSKFHQVDWFLGGDEPPDAYDWIIPWGVMSIPFNNTIEKYHAKKAIFCAGHPDDITNIEKFDVVFVESGAVYYKMRKYCKRIELAFGTDTGFFKPKEEKKIYDAFFPATFSPWKRQDLFAEAIGDKGLVCGVVQPDGVDIVRKCVERGTHVLAGLVPTRLVADLYNMSKVCVITSWHGSERTALEAMSSNIPLVVTKDNELVCSLLPKESIQVEPNPEAIRKGFLKALTMKINTRDYILDNFSHLLYATKIMETIEKEVI